MRPLCARVVELPHISVNYTVIKILGVGQQYFYGKFVSPVKRNLCGVHVKWPMLH
jgi:hypothetical protein